MISQTFDGGIRQSYSIWFLLFFIIITLILSITQTYSNTVCTIYDLQNASQVIMTNKECHLGNYEGTMRAHHGLPTIYVNIIPNKHITIPPLDSNTLNLKIHSLNMTISGGWSYDSTGLHLFCCIASLFYLFSKLFFCNGIAAVSIGFCLVVFWLASLVLDANSIASWGDICNYNNIHSNTATQMILNSFNPPLIISEGNDINTITSLSCSTAKYYITTIFVAMCLLGSFTLAYVSLMDFRSKLREEEDEFYDDPLYRSLTHEYKIIPEEA